MLIWRSTEPLSPSCTAQNVTVCSNLLYVKIQEVKLQSVKLKLRFSNCDANPNEQATILNIRSYFPKPASYKDNYEARNHI